LRFFHIGQASLRQKVKRRISVFQFKGAMFAVATALPIFLCEYGRISGFRIAPTVAFA
jgi:hypothetical protein